MKRKFGAVILVIALSLVVGLGAVSFARVGVADGAGVFVKDSVAKVAHITDIAGNMTMLEAGLAMVLDSDADYLAVSGDLSAEGDRGTLIDVANRLRQFQNDVRTDTERPRPDFQVLVVPGDRDLAGVSKWDFFRICSGLGYPNMTVAEEVEFYSSYERAGLVRSGNSGKLSFSYSDELSYVAVSRETGYAFVALDTVKMTRNGGVSGSVDTQINFLSCVMIDGQAIDYLDYTTILISHYNMLPHFAIEGLARDYVIEDYTFATDDVADLGIKYALTGHGDANSVAYRTSFNGNRFVDIQTPSLAGIASGVRFLSFTKGHVGTKYAEEVDQVLRAVTVDCEDMPEFVYADLRRENEVVDLLLNAVVAYTKGERDEWVELPISVRRTIAELESGVSVAGLKSFFADGYAPIWNAGLAGVLLNAIEYAIGDVAPEVYPAFGEVLAEIVKTLHTTCTPIPRFGVRATVFKYTEGVSVAEAPSVANGRLPEMITVELGGDNVASQEITYYTDPRVTATDLQYRIFGTSTWETEKGYSTSTSLKLWLPVVNFPMEDITRYGPPVQSIDKYDFVRRKHAVLITELKAGTTYEYRVGDLENGYMSPIRTFKTEGNDGSFDIMLVADIMGCSAGDFARFNTFANKAKNAFKSGPNLIMAVGRSTYNYDNALQRKMLLEANIFSNASVAFASAYGDGASTTFDYTAVHFVVLQMHDAFRSQDGRLEDSYIKQLVKDLDSTDKKYKVVIMDDGIFTPDANMNDDRVKALRAQLAPIFADNGVSYVFQGGSRAYAESFLLDGEGEKTDKKLGEGGVKYISLGTAGSYFGEYVPNDDVPLEYGIYMHSPRLSDPTFGRLRFDGKELTYVGYQYLTSSDTIKEVKKPTPIAVWLIVLIAVVVLSVVVLLIVSEARVDKLPTVQETHTGSQMANKRA